jgi:hypothetical protein
MNVHLEFLVDSVFMDPNRFNFYLQSHQAMHGTARSAHYHVLIDDVGFNEGSAAVDLSNLTHQLWYAFGRATGGVSYVAPAYIADRFCERGRVYLRGYHGGNLPRKPQGLPSEEQIKARKQACAQHVTRHSKMSGTREKLWSTRKHYTEDPAKGEMRINPWHPNMDKAMFLVLDVS